MNKPLSQLQQCLAEFSLIEPAVRSEIAAAKRVKTRPMLSICSEEHLRSKLEGRLPTDELFSGFYLEQSGHCYFVYSIDTLPQLELGNIAQLNIHPVQDNCWEIVHARLAKLPEYEPRVTLCVDEDLESTVMAIAGGIIKLMSEYRQMPEVLTPPEPTERLAEPLTAAGPDRHPTRSPLSAFLYWLADKV